MKAYTSGLTITKNTIIEKERRLPIKGKILCNLEDTVNHNTIIAEGEIKGNLVTFGFSKELNISPNEIDKYLIPKIGDKITRGDIIGISSSFFNLIKTTIKSPYTGILEYINKNTGTIGIRLSSTKIELNAYISGKVTKILPEEGAVIQTQGTYIQGIFGIGGEKYGNLIFGITSPNDKTKIPENAENKIIVTGSDLTLEDLKKCEKSGICAIITGGLSDTVIKEYTDKELGVAITGDENIPITIILTEGFGNIPISQTTFDILKSIEESFISVNGATQIRAGVIRPEIISSKDKESLIIHEQDNNISIGTKVRIMSEPYLCQYGLITKIYDQPLQLETGNFASCVEIQLNDKKVIIPRTNIEIIFD